MKTFMLLILLLPLYLFGKDKIAVAVNDLNGHGISESDTKIITERLRSELIKTDRFRVMERSEMDQILEEQGFQQSGACDDGSCLVEVGRLLAVSQLVGGSIGHIGDIYTMNIKIIAVESGEILYSSSLDYEGKISGLLSEGVQKMVHQIEAEVLSKSGDGQKGKISLTTTPAGASVLINKKDAGKSPLNSFEVVPGNVTISLSKRGYATIDTSVLVASAEEKSVILALKELPKESNGNKLKIINFSAGGAAAAGGLIAGVVFNSKLNELQDQYNNHTGDQAEFDRLRDEMNSMKLYRNISYGLAGAGAAVVSVSFFF